ncbi:hypothetical protein QBC38DRAFT_216244 [Podospora fimiseda]|uniref:Uncharacterized protein n=1 Tax=Podospora fimiseda TaxID=252190 RepID=A0AAN7BNZ4_9PEZI|nr:hypothetical protein QBC38DRAFT_216244 [Podospora fimiseda]
MLLVGRRRIDGGIDCSVRQFQSANNLGDDLLEESSKSAIREMIADDVINRTADSTCSRDVASEFLSCPLFCSSVISTMSEVNKIPFFLKAKWPVLLPVQPELALDDEAFAKFLCDTVKPTKFATASAVAIASDPVKTDGDDAVGTEFNLHSQPGFGGRATQTTSQWKRNHGTALTAFSSKRGSGSKFLQSPHPIVYVLSVLLASAKVVS